MRSQWILALAIFPIALAGCSRSSAPTAPDVVATPAALESQALLVPTLQSKLDSYWPNADGTSWSFGYQSEFAFSSQPTVYENSEEVPAAPSPEELLPLLRRPFAYVSPEVGTYRLRFDGMTTTESGATGQNLVETLEPASGGAARLAPGFRDRLLSRVAWARPELRSRIATLLDAPAELDQFPLLVHGGAWEKTPDHIGTYGDLDLSLAWMFLNSDLRPGSSFRFQLLPSITTDVYLNAWIVPHRLRDATSRGRNLEVVYVIDYGLSVSLDQNGAPNGYFRSIGYGNVVYSPGRGPVSSIERPIAWVEHPESPLGQVTISLRSADLLSAMR